MDAPKVIKRRDRNRAKVESLFRWWKKRFPLDYHNTMAAASAIRQSLTKESGMSNQGSMMLRGIIPETIEAMMGVICGPNWKTDPEVKDEYDKVFTKFRINHKSVANIRRDAPGQLDGAVKDSIERVVEDFELVDECVHKLRQANKTKLVIPGSP